MFRRPPVIHDLVVNINSSREETTMRKWIAAAGVIATTAIVLMLGSGIAQAMTHN
jgi:hypothetical protein